MINSPKKSHISGSIAFFPGIDEYLESIGHGFPINVDGLEEISTAISTKTGLSFEQSEIILRLFFQEIRHAIIRGDVINLRMLGKFLVSSPATTGNSRKVFVKFMPSNELLSRIRK
jgi:nucleoid DNA-binding protein